MTIKDIARLSGVGVTTVSRVLNDHPDVSEETRRRVLAVVAEQGFQPNTNARHLKQQTSASIAIIVKGTMNMLFAELMERCQQLLQDAGQNAAVYYLDEDANEVVYAVQLCRERKPLGILFLGGDLEFFQAEFGHITVPCVLLTNSARELDFPNLSSLTTDDEEAAYRVVRYLADQGHRDIGLLGGNWSCTQISYRRVLGCQRAFDELSLPFDARRCEPCRYSFSDAYDTTKRLLGRCPELTALFCVSDVMALGAIRAIHDLGRRVPRDISVVGYDGIPLSRFSVPRLTTVRQDTQQLARQGVDLLLRNLQRPRPPVHEVAPFQLIAGESVSPPRGATH
ncbi:MAG: LacI family transcriptional regulator [Oscillospiraceae bacterium]|nr:LacI family transcriptional regulator [Oscillospiraceae bacterium]